jgi:hypothetical protein
LLGFVVHDDEEGSEDLEVDDEQRAEYMRDIGNKYDEYIIELIFTCTQLSSYIHQYICRC